MSIRQAIPLAIAAAALAGCSAGAGPTTSPSPTESASRSVSPTSSPAPTPTAKPRAVALTNGDRKKSAVAITFDADLSPYALQQVREGKYGPQVNFEVIRFLERNEIPATVFVTGMWAKQYPDVLDRLAANPRIELANHTWNHDAWTSTCYDLPYVVGDQVKRSQVRRTSELLLAKTGRVPKFFRFPGLCHDQRDLGIVADENLWTVDYDLATSDAFAQDPTSAASAIAAGIRPGSIVILHLNGAPNAPQTAPILSQLVEVLDERGLEPVTLSRLLRGTTKAQAK